jgi:hypothetical protein
VAQRKDQLTLLDVRSTEAIIGPDGPIGGSRLIPLPKLEARCGASPRI